MTALRLYVDTFWFSPYSFAAFIAVREKRIKFTIGEIALHRNESEDPDYRKNSVTGRIPAIEDDGFWLAESNAIIEYLEERYPNPPLLPKDQQDRARARMLLAWIRSSRDLLPLIEERSTDTMFYERAKAPLSEKGLESAAKLIEVAELLLPKGASQLFSEWSIADSDLAFALQRLIINGDRLPERLRYFAETQWQRPSVQEFVRRNRPPFEPYSSR